MSEQNLEVHSTIVGKETKIELKKALVREVE